MITLLADRRAPVPTIDDVGVRLGDADRADRARGDLAVADRPPEGAAVFGLPDAAARPAHVEGARLAADAADRRDAAAAVRADRPPLQVLVAGRVDELVDVGLCREPAGSEARRRGAMAMSTSVTYRERRVMNALRRNYRWTR